MSPRPAYRVLLNPWLLVPCVLSLLVTSCKDGSGPGDGSSGQRDPATTKPSGASKPADAGGASSGTLQSGQWYRAWFIGGADVGHIPFFLRLPAPPHRGNALIVHGEQRIETEARWYGAEASVNLPLFRTRFFFRRGAAGKLEGHMMSRSPVVTGTVSLPMQAVPVPGPDDSQRFPDPSFCGASADPPAPAPPLPLGTWSMTFSDVDDGQLVIEERAPGVVAGTFKFRDSGVITGIGNVFGRRICLSSFDGAGPFLAVIDVEPGGKGLKGYWANGPALDVRVPFSADRREQVNRSTDGINFVPNRTPLSLFELGLPQYRGKPVIIEFGGSWCPPCIDTVPLLKGLYDKHRAEGLEIVTLLFEMLDDEDSLRKQARLFVESYDIPWTVVPVRGEIKPYWDIVPHDAAASEVNLPVTLFVNADGTIRDAHMGFPGPATGQAYQAMIERYQRTARELVSKN